MDTPKTIVACSVVTVTTVAFIWWYRTSRKAQIPSHWTPVGKVSDLYLYPLKSGRRVEVSEMQCTKYGPVQLTDKTVFQLRDRFLIVYDGETCEFKTGRTHPTMVMIEVSNHDADHVALDAPNMRTLYVQIPEVLKQNVRLCQMHGNEKTELVDCGNEAAAWLSRYMLDKESGVRLGYHDATLHDRKVEAKFTKFYPKIQNNDMGIFSDLTSFMLLNKASIKELNGRLADKVSWCQFRGNIIVDELDVAFVEDSWQWIKIGRDTVFQNVQPCTRCIFTTVNQETGAMDKHKEPLKTLRGYRQLEDMAARKAANFSPVMGINLGVRRTGVIAVQDTVYVA